VILRHFYPFPIPQHAHDAIAGIESDVGEQ
jgi:hypothetical protein